MDYPFFTARLFDLTAEDLTALQALAQEQCYQASPHFISQVHIDTTRLPEDKLPQAMLDSLERWGLLRSALVSSACNVLRANGQIFEHSDIEGSWPGAHRKAHRHIIHVPLVNEHVVYTHRRSRSEPQTKMRMKLGSVYLYNNYVLHSVRGSGAQRFNVILDYEDLDWSVKDGLLQALHIKTPGRYQVSDEYLHI